VQWASFLFATYSINFRYFEPFLSYTQLQLDPKTGTTTNLRAYSDPMLELDEASFIFLGIGKQFRVRFCFKRYPEINLKTKKCKNSHLNHPVYIFAIVVFIDHYL
jgi:hypothetical protein